MKTAQRAGAKPQGPYQDKRRTLTTRITDNLRRKLDGAAELAERSLSQEIELRLDASFRNENLLHQAMDLAFGRRIAVLLDTVARGMIETGRLAEFPIDWTSTPALFNEAVGAADEVLESFRPVNSSAAPLDKPLRGIAIGRTVVRAIHEPNHNIASLKEFGDAQRARLGTDAAARLNVARWDLPVSTESVVQSDRYTMPRNQA